MYYLEVNIRKFERKLEKSALELRGTLERYLLFNTCLTFHRDMQYWAWWQWQYFYFFYFFPKLDRFTQSGRDRQHK